MSIQAPYFSSFLGTRPIRREYAYVAFKIQKLVLPARCQ
jgi:hypothetical protein